MRIPTICCLMLAVLFAADAKAQNTGRCEAYWQERNYILKAYQVCLRSPRAIRYFGNGGCKYRDESVAPMSQADRERVAEIRAMEKSLGCRHRLASNASAAGSASR